MTSQALVHKHLYDLPTCLLEVWSERSPLSEWSERPIAQNLRFRLTFEQTGLLGRTRRKTIDGNQTQLGKLVEAVANYADRFLADDFVFNLTHQLSIPNLPKLNLSTLQLCDLLTSLEQCAIEQTILPTVELEVKRITPAWLKIAAAIVATVGISTSAVKLIFQQPIPELVTSSSRNQQEREEKAKSKDEIISSTKPGESNPTSLSPSVAPELDRASKQPSAKQPSAPAPLSTSHPAATESPRETTRESQAEVPRLTVREAPNSQIAQQTPTASQPATPKSPPPQDRTTRSENSRSPFPAKIVQDANRDERAPKLERSPSPQNPNSGSFRRNPPTDNITQSDRHSSLAKPNRQSHPLSESQNKPIPPLAANTIPQPQNGLDTTSEPKIDGYTSENRGRSRTNLPAAKPAITGANRSSAIEIGEIETTLGEDIKTSLSAYLRTVNPRSHSDGEVVLNISIENGKVVKVKLDQAESTAKNILEIENLKRSLLDWHPPTLTNGTIHIRLSFQARSN
jgi:hypothetical protein